MKANKEFDLWNSQKKQLDASVIYPHFAQRELWWAVLGKNISSESAGKGIEFLRPVLILKRVYGNALLGIPLTTKIRKGDYYFTFRDSKDTRQCALLPQIRYLDAKRLKYKISTITSADFHSLCTHFVRFIKNNPDEIGGSA